MRLSLVHLVIVVHIIHCLLAQVTINGDGLECSDYWARQLHCSCLHGCLACEKDYRNYDLERCINQCKTTNSRVIDAGPYRCTLFTNRYRKKRDLHSNIQREAIHALRNPLRNVFETLDDIKKGRKEFPIK